jgi:hypothetical protein
MLPLVIGLIGAAVLLGLVVTLRIPPDVPAELPGWPSLGFLYLQLLRSALSRKKAPADLKGKPIQASKQVDFRAATQCRDCCRLVATVMWQLGLGVGSCVGLGAATQTGPVVQKQTTYNVEPATLLPGHFYCQQAAAATPVQGKLAALSCLHWWYSSIVLNTQQR